MRSNMVTVMSRDLTHFRKLKRAPHHSSAWRYSPGKCFAVPPALSSRRASCGCVCRAALVRWALSARGVSAGGTGRLMVTSHSGCRELLRVTRALWAQSYKSVGTGSFPRMRNCADAHRQALGISNTERIKCARAHNNLSAQKNKD